MPLSTPMSSGTVTRQVIERIKRALLEGELKPGDKLPTESELCTIWQVSRTPIREAIKVLEFMGILEIRRSEGTFVANRVIPAALNPLVLKLLFLSESAEQFLEFRYEVEHMVLRLAMDKADSSAFNALESNIKDMEKAAKRKATPDEYLQLETEFHRILAESTKNPLTAELAVEVFDVFSKSVKRSHATSGPEAAIAHHKKLLSALIARDMAAGEAALTESLGTWRSFVDSE